MKFKRLIAAAGAALAVTAGIGLAASVTPAAASQGRASLTAAPAARAAPAQGPISQICSAQGSASLCANRAGGGEAAGTAVIGWSAGDRNNDFAYGYLTSMCGNGHVSNSGECPFTPGGGLNRRYNGDLIVEIASLSTPLNEGCIADSGFGTGFTVLGRCPNSAGGGGAFGVDFVLAQDNNINQAPPTTYVVSVGWSNSDAAGGGGGSAPRWLCVRAKGQQLEENSPNGNAGSCQWNELSG